jgi:hypothetical protein
VNASEALVVFTIDPLLFAFFIEGIGFFFDFTGVLLKKVGDDLLIVIVGCNM